MGPWRATHRLPGPRVPWLWPSCFHLHPNTAWGVAQRNSETWLCSQPLVDGCPLSVVTPRVALCCLQPSRCPFLTKLCVGWDWPVAGWWLLSSMSSINWAIVWFLLWEEPCGSSAGWVASTLARHRAGCPGHWAPSGLCDSPACIWSGEESGIRYRDLDRRGPQVLGVELFMPVPKSGPEWPSEVPPKAVNV